MLLVGFNAMDGAPLLVNQQSPAEQNGLPWWLTKRIVPVVHFIMQRNQLLGLARRVELSRSDVGATGPTSPGKSEAA